MVKGWGEVFASWFVRALKRDDLPVFGNPMRIACISAFFIPCFLDLPDFFDFSIDCFSFLYRSLSWALKFSAPL